MKKIIPLFLALVIPLAAFAQEAAKPASEPKKKILTSYRVEPKPGQLAELKSALAVHAKKFHHGEQAWRVGEVLSGPDAGMLHVTEGPTSWTALDDRGDLGPEHMKDFETNVLSHVARMTGDNYGVYQEDLSTTGMTQYTNKVGIMHFVVKPGRSLDAYDAMKRWKAIYEKLGLHIAVWHSAWSGDNAYNVVARFENGLKDLDRDISFRKAATELYGPNEYVRLQEQNGDLYSRIWSELVEFKPELQSQ